jgi:Polyketide cyclase / dehydrase and lipid transport
MTTTSLAAAGRRGSMKLSDAPSTQTSTHVDALPDVVWPVATDLTCFGEWSPEHRGGHWLDGADGSAAGHRFEGEQHHEAVGSWTTVATVVECDPPHRYSWAVGDLDQPGATWLLTVKAEDGDTRLTHHVTVGPGPSGISQAIEAMPDKEERILQRRLGELEAGMRAVLEGIRTAADASR